MPKKPPNLSIHQRFEEEGQDWLFDLSEPGQESVTVTSPVEEVEGWTVTVVLRRHDGRAAIDEVHFKAATEGVAFGARLMQKVRLGALQRDIWSKLRTGFGRFPLPDGWYDDFTARPRPGRGRRSDYWYAVWGERYEEALKHASRSPVKWLAEHYPESEAAIRAYLFKARDRSILEHAPHHPGKKSGQPGGALTEYGKGLLRGTHQET